MTDLPEWEIFSPTIVENALIAPFTRLEETEPSAVEISGPFTTSENTPVVAYMVRGFYQGSQHLVCMVTFNEPQRLELLTRFFRGLFNTTLAYAIQTIVAWREVPCFVFILEHGDEPQSSGGIFGVHQTKETDIRKVAEEVLSTMFLRTTIRVGADTYYIDKEVTASGLGFDHFIHYYVRKVDSDVGFSMAARNDIDLLDRLSKFENGFSELISVHEHEDKILYRNEIKNYLDSNKPIIAFRSYYFYVLLANRSNSQEDIDPIIQIGFAVKSALLAHELFDYAEWVCNCIAQCAEEAQRYDDAVEARRYAGIASEALGRIHETREHYERALKYLDLVTTPRLKSRLHMSYGISMLVLLSHCEAENVQLDSQTGILQEILQLAEQHLEIAHTLLKKENKKQARWSLYSTELELIRIEDLKGHHESALQRLTKLVSHKRFRHPNLLATAGVYQIAIYKKLADKDSSWQGPYYASLNDALPVFAHSSFVLMDKRCLFYTLLGQALLNEGQIDDAVRFFRLAYDIQLDYAKKEIRPPQSEALYGGLPVIDLCGKLQNALLMKHYAEENTSSSFDSRFQAFLIADDAKSSFFKRDLAFFVFESGTELPALIRRYDTNARDAFIKGRLDRRILIADYIWQISLVSSGAVDHVTQTIRGDVPLTTDDIQMALSNGMKKTALISLYATSQMTFVYLLDEPTQPPKVYTLDISLNQLKSTVLRLQAGVSGNALYPPINSQRPERKQKFFDPFLQFVEKFAPLLPHLEDVNLILISPHGLWHNLPLHALILPRLWEKGLRSSLSYIPSVRLYELLRKRDTSEHLTHFNNIGLTTAYETHNPVHRFAQAHRDLEDVFKKSGADVTASFGEQATDTRFLQDTTIVGLHHILAHGRYEQDRDPMNSTILLADASGVPLLDQAGEVKRGSLVSGAALLVNGTAAQHVTVQACSLGRSQSAQGDEFWGVSRALIAAGASSVIAPLWDIDLESSTRLLGRFYRNWLIDKLPKAEAWTDAQREFYLGQERAEWKHFYHWAAFRLIGC